MHTKQLSDSAMAIQSVTLSNHLMQVTLISLGASIQSVYLSDHRHSLVLGAKDPSTYLNQAAYFGSVVGPVANRIAQGVVNISDQQINLALENGEKHHLHGGPNNTALQNWHIKKENPTKVVFQLSILDRYNGYPGPMHLEIEYRLKETTLQVILRAKTEKDSICNLATHNYFNLDGTADVMNHRMQIFAEHYTPTDLELIPTGEIKSVANSAYDFRHPRNINRSDYPGLDTNFCLSNSRREVSLAAKLKGEKTGISMELWTTEAGLQVYDGSHISLIKDLVVNDIDLGPRSGIALEPQAWPDAPHNAKFPSIFLPANEQYLQVSEFRFK